MPASAELDSTGAQAPAHQGLRSEGLGWGEGEWRQQQGTRAMVVPQQMEGTPAPLAGDVARWVR